MVEKDYSLWRRTIGGGEGLLWDWKMVENGKYGKWKIWKMENGGKWKNGGPWGIGGEVGDP